MQVFNKKLQQEIIQKYTGHGYEKVANQLYSSAQMRTLEYHIHTQVKAYWKGDTKSHKECSYMGCKCNEAEF